MSFTFWAFTAPFIVIVAGIVGGIALHFYAQRRGEREERFWRGHQTEWTDDLARRRAQRERAESRFQQTSCHCWTAVSGPGSPSHRDTVHHPGCPFYVEAGQG